MNAEPDEPAHCETQASNPDHDLASGHRPVVLRTCGLKRVFGKVSAVDGLDLSVHAGEIYGFLGVNGAGKTTAIRILMGIIKSDEGTLELLGKTIRRTTIQQKQSIGYVSQEQTFYPWMTCRALGRFVGGLYPTWDAPEFDRLLRVLDLPPDRKVSQLSGGMRVKLALALALAPHPALLILDEPTSGLDPLARRQFLDIIQRETREHGHTTFFSSHIIDEIERVADRVGIIHRGRMQYEGSLESLRASVRRVDIVTDRETSVTQENRPPILEPNNPTESSPDARPRLMLEGLEILRDEARDGFRSLVLRGPSSAWQAVGGPGIHVQELSVEDIFVALVGKEAIVA